MRVIRKLYISYVLMFVVIQDSDYSYYGVHNCPVALRMLKQGVDHENMKLCESRYQLLAFV